MNKYCNDNSVYGNKREAKASEKESFLKSCNNTERYSWSCFFASIPLKEYLLYICIAVMVSALLGWLIAPFVDLAGIISFVMDNFVLVITLLIAFVAGLFFALSSRPKSEKYLSEYTKNVGLYYRWLLLISVSVIVFISMVTSYNPSVFQIIFDSLLATH